MLRGPASAGAGTSDAATRTAPYVAGMVGPLAVSILVSKLDKLGRATERFSLHDVPGALGLDVALLLLFGGACAFVFGRPNRRRWRPAAVALQVVALVALLVSVLDHAFFRSQGEYLPGEMLRYAVANAGMLRVVLASKVTPGIAVAVGLSLATLLLPVALSKSWRPRGRRRPVDWRRWAAWAGAVLVGFGASRLPVSRGARHLKRNTVVALVAGALRPAEESGAMFTAIAEPTRLVATGEPRHRNVVLVILESARASSTTPYAPDLATTPFLAELARRGLRVEHAYAPVPHTSKAIISILCGRDPKLSTAIHEARPGGIPGPCLPELLADRGYATAFVQPADEEFERRRSLVSNMGFDTFMGRESLEGAGFEESSYFGFEDESMLGPALAWTASVRRPFFLTLLTLTAHHDYRLPSSWAPTRFAEDESLNRYLNALAYSDRFVSRLFAAIEKQGPLDETLFVVVGDHGEAFGEHGRWEHDNVLYEEGVRVPLVMAGAGLRPQRVVRGLRKTADLVPTIAEVLGYRAVGERVSGLSLLSGEGHRRLYFSCWYARQCMALREGSRKTIFHYDHGSPEVFDLVADPLENDDLAAGSAARSGRIEEAIRKLKDWKRRNEAEYRRHFEELESRPGVRSSEGA